MHRQLKTIKFPKFNLIKSLENFKDGYYLLKILYIYCKIFSLNNIGFSEIRALNQVHKKVINLKFRVEYSYYFKRLELKIAYQKKLLHIASIAKGYINGNQSSALEYLKIIKDDSFYDFLEIKKDLLIYLRSLEPYVFSNISHSNNLINLGKAIIIGPKTSLDAVSLDGFDTIIFLKTPKIRQDIQDRKIVVILNNAWIKYKSASIADWKQSMPHTIFISPQDIEPLGISRHQGFNFMPSSINGASPMGLQRALLIINLNYSFSSLLLSGFDFGLSQMPYHHSYPSLIKDLGEEDQILLKSNAIHDFFYNFQLTKKILDGRNNIHGAILEILNYDAKAVVSEFTNRYMDR